MRDTPTTLHNLQATDGSLSSATLAGGKQCVESESDTEASAHGALTLEMVNESFERMRNRNRRRLGQTYNEWYGEQVMRAAKRRMGL